MTLLLNVPFNEKDEAKKKGAKWNPDFKKWSVWNRKDYQKFAKWFNNDDDTNIIICDHIYIIDAYRKCFKCGKKTKVIGFGIEKYLLLYSADLHDLDESEVEYIAEYYNKEINIASQISNLPKEIVDYIQNNYNYKMTYSKFTGTSYLANCCEHCDIIQGDHFLFSEVDSPFFMDSIQKARNLKLYKFDLNYDIAVSGNVSWGSNDYLIKKYGEIIETGLKV
ncbi:DUF5710 domain-containing protein [Ureibacillus chungkukjangi]|uniref:DUF5710 domain-containing protein n=1 Tax=Ureibacillus chungkukjangi TaxID=1202712 RepID=UPI00203B630B|nr:DUF5710 domain-containing protein [Ureibacillus chungkukjangi]MCM3390596.1 DUF5710 domain-containing protein [Ureibacillus chungkukjangi]